MKLKTIFFFSLYLILSIQSSCIKPGKNKTKPNILLINIDDMGWRDVGFMGSEYYETPNLDKLASGGMFFTNAYASASNCAPSRACMMSGQWTPRHGIYTVGNSDRGESKDRRLVPTPNNEYMPDDHILIPEVLQKAGYATCHAGKWHLTDDPALRGFDVNIGGSHAGNPGSYYPPYKNVPSLEAPTDEYYLTTLIMDKTLQFLDGVDGKPFFLYYSPYAVHTPIHPVKDLLPKYMNKPGWNGQNNSGYATMVENLDIQIGRLINKLEKSGKLENTFILITSDNGGPYEITKQWPLRAGKGSYYEGGIRVPMLAFWKGKIRAGTNTDVPVTNLDFYPTILEVAGVSKPVGKTLDGASILPLLTGGGTIESRPLYWHFPIYLQGGNNETQDSLFRTRPGSAVRYGHWKLIQYFENNDVELYNLEDDIDEKNNLAEANQLKRDELLKMLDHWRDETNAPVPTMLNSDYQKEKESNQGELPNIILLMGDDHGWDEVAYNGHPFVKTPVLDEMAASGLRFDRFYSGHPSCSPTRGSFITGRHPNRYGTFTPGYSIRPEEISIAHLLKKAGYASAHFGKWHLGPVKKESPTNPGAMGFDEWFSHDNFFELNPIMSRNGESPQRIEGEGSEIIIDETIRFIQKSEKQNKPFLAVVWFGSPHEPYSGLPGDLSLYDDLPDSLAHTEVGLSSNETGERVMRPLRDVLQERYAEITAMDRAIGKLRSYLKENDLKENTLILYCGDNGTPPSAARTAMTIRGQKGNMYEGGVRVPGVMEWPAVIKEPATTSAISVTTDILPTLAEITGQPLPERPLDGTSLVPLFSDPSKQRPQPLYFWSFNEANVINESSQPYIDTELQEGTTPLVKMLGGKFTRTFRNYKYDQFSENDFTGERTMMNNQYKLVLEGQSPNGKGFELYDLENDRGETINLADRFPEIVEEMQTQLHEWQESVLNSLSGADYK